MSKVLNIFVSTIFLQLLCPSVWGQACNSAGLRKYDSNMARLLTIGNSGRKFPVTKGQDLKVYCRESDDLAKELESYKSRCMTGAAKQTLGILNYATKQAIKQMCIKDSKQLAKLIVATPCLNNGNAEVGKCLAKMIDSMLGAVNEPDDKKKIPFLCCEMYKIMKCIETRLMKINQCDEAKVGLILDFVNKVSGNMLDLLCSDYSDDSDKCAKLGPPPKKRKNQLRTKSFALPFIDVLATFPEV